MKKIIMLITLSMLSVSLNASTYVNGYTKSNGTYVKSHYRSDSNNTKSDNYSTYGNTNPYTGKAGTIRENSRSGYYGY